MSTSSSTTGVGVVVDAGAENVPPELSALFLIRFDKKVGYTIAWKRTAVDVSLDGAVEFKSLPSGLHTVKSDLVYFVHEGYAGLSAYNRGVASVEERGAEFVSVGILVSRAYGRLGRSWLLAARLRSIAATLADDPSATAPLEAFWEEHSTQKGRKGGGEDRADSGQHKRHSRARALSTISTVDVTRGDQLLPSYHPALSMLKYVETFGPLVFRLQQAALLRKRILFVGNPPVRKSCEYVYDLSVLSSIPPHAAEFLSPGTDQLLRLPALFSIGVNDIAELEKMCPNKANGTSSDVENVPVQGWVANTTDEIMAMKKQLYDIVVQVPPAYDAPPTQRKWPTMRTSDGAQIKASQRDLTRFKMLWRELRRHGQEVTNSGQNGEEEGEEELNEDDDDQAALLPSKGAKPDVNEDVEGSIGEHMVEPITWSRLAYNGFIWWASAGEQDAYTSRERDRGLALLGDLSDYREGLPTAIIAYFHRLTTQLITEVNSLIEGAEDDDANGDEDEEGVLMVDKEDISRMGLDRWSEADKAFLSEFVWMWFGRIVEVRGTSIDCCGVRIPVP